MAKLDKMAIIQERFCSGPKPVAKFLTVYIEEASDGKGINNTKPVGDYHRSLEDRVNAANRFVSEVKFTGEVICDSMKNEALDRYNAHPERICIVQNGLLVHTGGKGPLVFYDIEGVIAWLDQCFGYDSTRTSPPPSSSISSSAATATSGTKQEVQNEEEGECSA